MIDKYKIQRVMNCQPMAIFISMLIFLSMISYTIETLPDISVETLRIIQYLDISIVVIFSIEYLLRVYSADNRIKFIFSWYGLIDLVAILPFYLALGMDASSLRALRLFRLLRLLKLARYNKAMIRFVRALNVAREELIIFSLASLILLYFSAAIIYYFEHAVQPNIYRSIFDSLWWAVATLTTVGYGDIYPVTSLGRAFTVLILIIGLGMVSVPAGIIASAFSAVRREDERDSKISEN